jgi:hypothetical protein
LHAFVVRGGIWQRDIFISARRAEAVQRICISSLLLLLHFPDSFLTSSFVPIPFS